MTKAAPIVNEALFTKFSFHPTPIRLIGKMPVFEDDIGEFVLIDIKVIDRTTKKMSIIQIKVDAEIGAIRNAYELTLRTGGATAKSPNASAYAFGYLIDKIGGFRPQGTGEASIPYTLFGKEYHFARRSTTDDRDFRKSAFTPVVK